MSDEMPGLATMNLNFWTMQKIVQDYLREHGGALMADVTVNSISKGGDDFLVILESPAAKPGVMVK